MRISITRSALAGTAVVLAVVLSACGAGKTGGGTSAPPATNGPTNAQTTTTGTGASPTQGAPTSSSLTIGTTDQVVAVDPAGSYDFGSTMIEVQIYQYLMVVPPSGKVPVPDAAKSCGFKDSHTYTCTMKPGLKFSNGDPLTAKDAAFTFQRIVKINNPNGPASLLANMKSVSAPNDRTVVFKLKSPNDQTFPYVLGTSAGPLVDSKVFPADKLLSDEKCIGSGPYMLKDYNKNQQVTFAANPNYSGPNTAKTPNVTLRYYTESSNLKLDIQSGAIDVAYRSLTPTDISSLSNDSNVKVLKGAGGELRYIVFNLNTMPGANDAQKLAIRHAIAYSVNRDQLANDVYKGTYQPAYSMLPNGVKYATKPFAQVYGTQPNLAKAKQALQQAGVQTPVTLNIWYTTDHYGSTSTQEYGAIKQQLESTGLFKVNLSSALWTTYSVDRTQDKYQIYQLGWFPDFPDGDNYLAPFLVPNNFVAAHYCDPNATNRPCDKDGVLPLLAKEQSSTGTAREVAFAHIQQKLATGTMPYLPLLSGYQVAVTGTDVSGVQETLDPSYLFRMWMISKSG